MAERHPTPSPELLRSAILNSVPEVPAAFDDVPTKYLYVPSRHVRALDPNGMLVTGIRGAGKSFWWFALQEPAIREAVVRPGIDVSLGFGQGHNSSWPDRDELEQLLALKKKPRLIWKAVVLRQIAPDAAAFGGWAERVDWVEANPSSVARELREFDARLSQQQRMHVVLFDALDRTADSREDQERLLSGLLQLVLELRSFHALRAKVFARPDMLEGSTVKAFPDASKVLASAVKLEWSTLDLFGLLFQYLGNGDDADAAMAFRRFAERAEPREPWPGLWVVPSALREDSARQKSVFDAIAGPYMGTNARRGMTYTWVPNHLCDALDTVSPRSFLAAIGGAAQVPSEHKFALHWKGLHEGVRHASRIRVEEIQEDLPWAHQAMGMLENLVVPCTRAQVFSAWRKGRLFEGASSPLPPDPEGVMEELKRTGILKVLADGRINIPDVYRLGFGLRRKGGFAPRR